MKVIARTSAFALKGKHEDIRRIAEALGVSTVLEGSVRRSGNRLRVTAQLITASDGSHLWSERYDRELTDVFAIQDEIAAAIAGKLEVKLGVTAAQHRYTPKLLAYEALLKGRHLILAHDVAQQAPGKMWVEQAMKIDPGYAQPHATMGLSYFLLSLMGARPANETMAHMRSAVERDPLNVSWRAILASHLVHAGRIDEAIDESKQAMALDPSNLVPYTTLGEAYVMLERWDDAIGILNRSLRIGLTSL